MTVHDMARRLSLAAVHVEEDRELAGVYCCDLLSIAMARAKTDGAWVTVMGNANAVAVASLADVACIVLAEGCSFDEAAVAAANGKVSLYKSEKPIYEMARAIGDLL
jgi:predicted P-loop ATPase/GTPase